jgi:hypothetical protein
MVKHVHGLISRRVKFEDNVQANAAEKNPTAENNGAPLTGRKEEHAASIKGTHSSGGGRKRKAKRILSKAPTLVKPREIVRQTRNYLSFLFIPAV